MFSLRKHVFKVKQISEILNNIYKNEKTSKNFLTKRNFIGARTSANFCTNPQENIQKEINFDNITNGDKELEHKLKVLMLETEVLRQEGIAVPDNEFLKEKHWKELLDLPSRSKRCRYLEYLFKLSKTKENRQAKKEENRKNLEEHKANRVKEKLTIEEHAHQYDLQNNCMFLRFYDSTMNDMYNNRLLKAHQFGEKIVIDCGYDGDMTKRENINCAKQLMLVFAENRFHVDPFDVHFCNANFQGEMMQMLEKFIPTMHEKWFPMNVHEQNYLDLFPKEKLIYLTPHCQEEMVEYKHDAVYIIGGLVDKVNNQPLSLAKAKKQGVKMLKFPLDRYLHWGDGSGKSLTINQCVSILLDIKKTGDWEYALRHVPRRKIVNTRLGQHITDATNNMRFDKAENRRKWTPKSNRVIRSIFNE